VVEQAILDDEGGGLEPRMDVELREDVLDMRSCRFGADDERLGDVTRSCTTGQEREHLAFPGGERCDPQHRLVVILAPLDQVGEERAEHRRRDECFAAGDGTNSLDELCERAIQGQIRTRAAPEILGQETLVLRVGEGDDTAPRNPLLDLAALANAVVDRRADAQDHDVGAAPLRCGDRRGAVRALGDDIEVWLPFERGLQSIEKETAMGCYQDPKRLLRVPHGLPQVKNTSTT
jgi:hypothetical protein